MDDDDFVLIDETPRIEEHTLCKNPWTILVVDDDEDIHVTTKLALDKEMIHGRSLTFIDAYTGKEAMMIVENNNAIDLMLLDAVMEHPDAGLECAKYVKEVLKKDIPIIVLRTGFSGKVTEDNVHEFHCFNDYVKKGESTREKLINLLKKHLVR